LVIETEPVEKQGNNIIYSDQITEILGTPPGKIVRYGVYVIFLIMMLFILLAWLIRYPDTIPAPVEITTVNPPVTLVSKVTGHIRYMYAKDREKVSAGQLLAVMETTASMKEMDVLRKTLSGINRPDSIPSESLPFFTELGEIQGYYATFIRNLTDLNNYNSNDYYGNKIKSLNAEINGIEEYISRLKVKEKLFSENRNIEEKKYRRDSSLYLQNVISESDLERSRQLMIRINIEIQQVRLDHSEKTIELAEKQQLLQDYRIKRVEEKEKLVSALYESYLNLKAQLNIWENNYLLISPVEGIVSFTRFWNANQSVVKDEQVMNVVPIDTGAILGRITLKMQRSGKVRVGQMVNIKLSGYPYLEFGMVRGYVKSKSLLPSGNIYIIELTLPDGLTTLYGKKLDFTQNMQGTAEIITEDVRLLQKIFNPFRYLVSRNRR
jgi:multidrug resistance efflux pump